MFSQLLSDIGILWAKYGTVYLNGIANTLILAVTATLIGCVIGFWRRWRSGSWWCWRSKPCSSVSV